MPNAFVSIPDWFAWENHGTGVAVGDLNGDAQPELLVLMVDNPPGTNRGLYRVGTGLDGSGSVSGWSDWIEIPDWFSFENQGAGLALTDLDGDGRPELVVFMIDNPVGKNQGYYRIGKALDANGNVTGGWGPWIAVPDWFPFDNQHGSIAIADLNGDGRPELIVLMVDNPPEQNQAYYRVGRTLNANGEVTGGWTDWTQIPDWFSWENQGAGIAVASLTGPGVQDLVVFQVDNPIGQNQGFFRIGRNVGADGQVQVGDWGPWLGVPNWLSWENEGSGIGVATRNGRQEMVVLAVDNPAGQNAGLYQLVDLVEDPALHGRWEVQSFRSGVLAVHAAVVHTGKVLFFAGSGSSAVRFRSPDFGDASKGIFMSVVWDPAVPPGPGDPNFSHPATLRTANGAPFDFFCGGDCFLPDGRMLSAGGTLDYQPFKGRADVTVFDPVSATWSFVHPMQHGRWYPTLITLGDGRVLATTGLNEAGNGHNQALEIYAPDTDTWEQHHFAPGFAGLPLYAHLFLMRDGRVFFSGGRMDDPLQVQPCLIDPQTTPVQTLQVPDLLDPVLRNQSASVLLPPAQDQRVMIIGGGPVGKEDLTHATGMVSIVDLQGPNPAYAAGPPMLLPRMHLNAVLLPDRTVLVVGGSLQQEANPLARLQAERYDPATNSWQLMATATVPRLYHSTALLLPDGRVVAAGGNPEGGQSVSWEPPDPQEEMRIEIFSPPYLFKGPRPAITSVPTEWTYGQTITVQSPQAASIRWVDLIRSGVTTHSFDSSQRLVDVGIAARDAGSLQLKVTGEPNIAPPGWYMLFLVDMDGVPSIASWIHLT